MVISRVLNVAKWRSGDVAPKTGCARYRRKVIFEAQKLRIRGLEIAVRSNSLNSCYKSAQLEAENLEAHEKCCTFALSKVKSEE